MAPEITQARMLALADRLEKRAESAIELAFATPQIYPEIISQHNAVPAAFIGLRDDIRELWGEEKQQLDAVSVK